MTNHPNSFAGWNIPSVMTGLFSVLSLRMKQNKYPVLFLTQGDTPRWVSYTDPRSLSVRLAADFAVSNSLLVSFLVQSNLCKAATLKKNENWFSRPIIT